MKVFKHPRWFFLLLCLLSFFVNSVLAAQSPIGSWQTFDLDNVPRSVVKFYEVKGELKGKIVKIFPVKGHSANDICDKCPGQWKNKPKVGMVIIWGLKPEGVFWKNGYVLDTDSGKIYRCQISLSEDGKILHFRAYMGTPVFGRTINWKIIK